MERLKVTDVMREALKKPLPSEAVKQHPTKTYLSSIKAIYVTERLNDVFGVGSWSLKTDHVATTDLGMVVCKTTMEIPDYGIYYESFGGSDNGGEKSKNFDLGDAYKGATTDAITKICSYLEIGIDVFKGKHDKTAEANTAPKRLPALNPDTEQWTKAIAYLKGPDADVSLIKQKYYISPENETELLKQSK